MTSLVCKAIDCTNSVDGSFNVTGQQALYCSDACRARQWKRDRGYGLPEARQPRSNGTKRRRPGVTVYFRSIEAAEEALRACEIGWVDPEPASVIRAAISRRKANA